MRANSYMLAIVSSIVLITGSYANTLNNQLGIPEFFPNQNPNLLSEWNLLRVRDDILEINPNVTVYSPASSLFSDYSGKLRTVWLSKNSAPIEFGESGELFDVGTVLTKTFFFMKSDLHSQGQQRSLLMPGNDELMQIGVSEFDLNKYRLIETRLLIKRSSGWESATYLWSDTQNDAELIQAGVITTLELLSDAGRNSVVDQLNYIVPNKNQCISCHGSSHENSRSISPIGFGPKHLDHELVINGTLSNQLENLIVMGIVEMENSVDLPESNVNWKNSSLPLEDRARSYLDINCAHCHNDAGFANTSGLNLNIEERRHERYGVCKIPIAAGQGTGNLRYDIVPNRPDESILLHRMKTERVSEMMPEIGRTIQHKEGVELISNWIHGMSLQSCESERKPIN